MRFTTFTCSIVFTALMLGCAAQKKQRVYRSVPPVQKMSNAVFDAQIESLKLDNPFYVSFQLTIKNKSAVPLAIDWNETHYLHNGKDLGVFVYRGIDPDKVKEGLANEMIPAMGEFSRRISPWRTLAFMRRGETPPDGKSHFYPGILPNGTNTVRLVMRQEDNVWRESLSVKLVSKEILKP